MKRLKQAWRYFNQDVSDAFASQGASMHSIEAQATHESHMFYVLSDMCGHVKVGHAYSVLSRVSALQCGSAYPILVLAIATVRSGNRAAASYIATCLERTVHEDLRHKRVFGEWFECDADVALDAATHALKAAREELTNLDLGELEVLHDAVALHNRHEIRERRQWKFAVEVTA